MTTSMENNLDYLKGKRFNFCYYAGQYKALRRYAFDLWGADEVAMMSDDDIESKFIKLGYIPVIINFEGNNTEEIYILKRETLGFAKCLSR